MTWRQPTPSWVTRRRQEHQTEAEERHKERVGVVMGLDVEGGVESSSAVCGELHEGDRVSHWCDQVAGHAGDHQVGAFRWPRTPIAQGEHYAVSRQFLLAGRAVFTITGKRGRFTFRILKNEPEAGSQYGPSFYVYVLTGKAKPATDESEDDKHRSAYTYIGFLNTNTGEVRMTKGSKLPHTSPAVVAVQWALPRLWAGRELPAPAAVYREDRCGRCARPLTDPESIAAGIGPDCRKLMGIKLKGEE